VSSVVKIYAAIDQNACPQVAEKCKLPPWKNTDLSVRIGSSRKGGVGFRIEELMICLWSDLRKFAALVLLCILTIASVGAPICPECSKIDLPSATHCTFSTAHHDSAPNCDRDGCSCCGFQVVCTPLPPSFGLTASTPAPDLPSVRLLAGSPFTLYRPPRR
jgi:hypothetical protein